MLFNSFAFLLLFPIAAILYGWLRGRGWRNASQMFLLALSMGFYCWGGFYSLPFLVGSIVFNWATSLKIGDRNTSRKARKAWLLTALTANIAFLSLFKYVNFFLSVFEPLFHAHFAIPEWRFPLGISFFTLTQVMYLVDCFEDLILPSSLFDHATFASFFPYISAGPLARARPMIKQLGEAFQPISSESVARGLLIFCMGLFKKTVLADSLVRIADPVFTTASMPRIDTWCGVLAYSLQLYFDFCGYSEMALGVAKMMGFEIPINFNAPFRSKSEIEFWQRWHISLSMFITTYLYTPIMRAFKGKATVGKAAIATIFAMTICGLWHGPAWTYVVWGLLHGLALAVNQLWRKKLKIPMPTWTAWLFTFTFINFADIFVRAPSMGVAYKVIRDLFVNASSTSLILPLMAERLIYLIPSLLALPIALLGPSSIELMQGFRPTLRNSFAYATVAVLALIFLNSVAAKTFIYIGF